jgi:hypothetical protein
VFEERTAPFEMEVATDVLGFGTYTKFPRLSRDLPYAVPPPTKFINTERLLQHKLMISQIPDEVSAHVRNQRVYLSQADLYEIELILRPTQAILETE